MAFSVLLFQVALRAKRVQDVMFCLHQEVVVLFRPECSLIKVDQGFISGCYSHGFCFAGMNLVGGQDVMGRVGPLGDLMG